MSEPVKPDEGVKAAPKAATAAGPSVIRMVHGAEETPHDRLMKKHVPAWVVSGAVHVVILTIFIIGGRYLAGKEVVASEEIIQAVVDPAPDEEKTKDLTNPDEGLESELKTAIDSTREDVINSDQPVVPNEAVGQPNSDVTAPTDAMNLAGIGNNTDVGAIGDQGSVMTGAGANGLAMAKGMSGRSGATRDMLVKAGGGNDASEAAVARGLAWLARQQKANGSWVYDGTSSGDMCASTSMALLPFLAAGQTHKPGKGNTYQAVVLKGLDYLLSLQNPANGSFRTSSNMYSHSIAAVALCELYGMTGDKRVLYPARQAIDYVVKAQGPNGSWGYKSGQDGDTSIVGWQIQALKSAEMTKDIPFPKTVYEKARKFLDSVTSKDDSKKATYGYREGPGQPGTALTAVGLLCRYYMDGWGPVHPGLQAGVEGLAKRNPPAQARFNMYYYYYATQVVHFHEGDVWHKDWNPKMRDMLIKMQVPQDKPDAIKGSWDKDQGMIGSHCGRLGTTCLCLLTLEVYYRHLPLYKRGTDGKAELERAK